MTVTQTAARWGVTVSLVRRWAREGRIPGARLRPVAGQPRPVWEIPREAERPGDARRRGQHAGVPASPRQEESR